MAEGVRNCGAHRHAEPGQRHGSQGEHVQVEGGADSGNGLIASEPTPTLSPLSPPFISIPFRNIITPLLFHIDNDIISPYPLFI